MTNKKRFTVTLPNQLVDVRADKLADVVDSVLAAHIAAFGFEKTQEVVDAIFSEIEEVEEEELPKLPPNITKPNPWTYPFTPGTSPRFPRPDYPLITWNARDTAVPVKNRQQFLDVVGKPGPVQPRPTPKSISVLHAHVPWQREHVWRDQDGDLWEYQITTGQWHTLKKVENGWGDPNIYGIPAPSTSGPFWRQSLHSVITTSAGKKRVFNDV
jgi:hypothetical protein